MRTIARAVGVSACGFALACTPQPRSPEQDGSPRPASADADKNAPGGYLERVVQVHSDGGKSCALTEDGSVYCWGHPGGWSGSKLERLYKDAPRPYLVPAERPATRLFENYSGVRALDVDGKMHASGSVHGCRDGDGSLEQSQEQQRRWLEAFPDEVVRHDKREVLSTRLLPRPATLPVGSPLLDVETVGVCRISDEGALICIDDCGADTLEAGLLKRPHVEAGVLLDSRAPTLSAAGKTLYGPLPECFGERSRRGECDLNPEYEASFSSDIREFIRSQHAIAVLHANGSVSYIMASSPLAPEHAADPLPVYESFGTGFSTIAMMSALNRICGVQTDGPVFCQVPGPEDPRWNKVQTISGATDIVQLSAGSVHMCGLRTDGRVACWGWNGNGELGNGELSDPESEQKHATLVVAPAGGQSDGPQVAHRMNHTFRVPVPTAN